MADESRKRKAPAEDHPHDRKRSRVRPLDALGTSTGAKLTTGTGPQAMAHAAPGTGRRQHRVRRFGHLGHVQYGKRGQGRG